MSDPVEKPKLLERDPERPKKPADKPEKPADKPEEPAEKPELFPRDPDDPPAKDPVPEPTPRDPSEWPKIATERLMDADEDGDGMPDRWGERGPILGDDDDLGDIVESGPTMASTSTSPLVDDITLSASIDAPSPGIESDLLDASSPKIESGPVDASSPRLGVAEQPGDAATEMMGDWATAPLDDPGEMIAQAAGTDDGLVAGGGDGMADQQDPESAVDIFPDLAND